jgi:hypothetical protein
LYYARILNSKPAFDIKAISTPAHASTPEHLVYRIVYRNEKPDSTGEKPSVSELKTLAEVIVWD